MAVDLEAAEFGIGESEAVFEWRLEELVRGGFPELIAIELAISSHVDLHAAVALRSRGCPPETAARILL
jgi:hypothetical protein